MVFHWAYSNQGWVYIQRLGPPSPGTGSPRVHSTLDNDLGTRQQYPLICTYLALGSQLWGHQHGISSPYTSHKLLDNVVHMHHPSNNIGSLERKRSSKFRCIFLLVLVHVRALTPLGKPKRTHQKVLWKYNETCYFIFFPWSIISIFINCYTNRKRILK